MTSIGNAESILERKIGREVRREIGREGREKSGEMNVIKLPTPLKTKQMIIHNGTMVAALPL